MNDVPGYAMNLTVGLAAMVSLATLFRLFQKHIDGRPLLEYEPRRPVPWNFLAPLILLGPLVMNWSAALLGELPPDPIGEIVSLLTSATSGAAASPPAAWLGSHAATTTATQLARELTEAGSMAAQIWMGGVMSVLITLAGYALLTIAFRATGADLGLPTSWRQFRGDVVIGAAACAASLVPIYSILYVLTSITQPEEGHPLVQHILLNPSINMLAAGAFAALVAAPLYEETAFRLVLQGWLERREASAATVVAGGVSDREAFTTDGVAPTGGVASFQPAPGWIPVFVTSVLFGLAHWGHGASPAPLILLGVVLGYLYRQTHRIVPGVVCHMMFNLLTLVMLSLYLASQR